MSTWPSYRTSILDNHNSIVRTFSKHDEMHKNMYHKYHIWIKYRRHTSSHAQNHRIIKMTCKLSVCMVWYGNV
jgi:hypothetical protein